MKTRFATSLLAVMVAGAHADEASIQRCRKIDDPTARLACYDAVAMRPGAAASATPAQAVAAFGLDARPANQGPDTIESSIEGRFEGWGPNDRITLANGQVWQVVDGSSGAFGYVNPRVRIRRGLLGAYFLEIEDSNRSPRVVRTR